MGSCVGEGGAKGDVDLCTCIVEDLLGTFTVDELEDTDKMKKYVREIGGPKCVK